MLRAACGGDVSDVSLEDALAQPNAIFYDVRDGDYRLGFIVFLLRGLGVAELHTCLLTLGQRTREAVRLAISDMVRAGTRLLLAIYPAVNRAARKLVEDLGFREAAELAQFYPEDFRSNHEFKELPCLG